MHTSIKRYPYSLVKVGESTYGQCVILDLSHISNIARLDNPLPVVKLDDNAAYGKLAIPRKTCEDLQKEKMALLEENQKLKKQLEIRKKRLEELKNHQEALKKQLGMNKRKLETENNDNKRRHLD